MNDPAILDDGPPAPRWREADRLAALARYAVLDTPLEPLFDELARLAADVCDAPMAVINFIAEGRQWFKAEVGIGARELPLDVSICRHAILQSALFVVPDLRADARFDGNPLIHVGDGLRFYAGALLETPDGLPLGTLCVLDRRPRPHGLGAREARVLRGLARQVMAELELRLALAERDAQIAAQRDGMASLAALRDASDAAALEKARLVAILEATPDLVGTSLASGAILYLNPAARRVRGVAPDAPLDGHNVMDFYPRYAARHLAGIALPAAVADGLWEGEIQLVTAAGELLNVSQTIIAHKDATGTVDFYSTVARDISAAKRAEERERLLAREVDHRSKNLLTVVQSIIQLGRGEHVPAFKTALVGRVQSLARSHSLLAAERWAGAGLRRLIEDELEPFARGDAGRIAIDGGELMLRPEAAQALALVAHELTTNAAKYGALSTDAGRLRVAWRIDGEELTLDWTEDGGPAVTAPTTHGFGTTVLRASIERQLRGRVAVDWRPQGIHAALRLPVAVVAAKAATAPPPARSAAAAGPGASLAARRVLVLEDEALIALRIVAALEEAGCVVVGPVTRLGDALELLRIDAIDAALLDVNVAGDRSFALADALAARGVPFAFCTGYAGAEALPARFATAMTIAKPFASETLRAAVRALLEDR